MPAADRAWQGAAEGGGGQGAAREGGGDVAVLDEERARLCQARRFLRMMREDVRGLRALAGDPVSQEYLRADLLRRADALRDLPDTPLFFGRLDHADGESLHIGRRHVHDPGGRPVVIDWRAPVSRPFYRASPSEPMGLARRRRFGFAGGKLTAYEDEDFGEPGAARRDGASRLLLEEIQRPRSGPMRDIVATIQPDQDDIVRAGAGQTLCVQGAPGTGKTAVGLHRVAYLLYAHERRMLRGGVLVIGPNRAFLSYIREVLPALGEADVAQVTVADLLAAVPVRAADSEHAARVKGDARMAEVLARALWRRVDEAPGEVTAPRGSRRWRVSGDEVAGLVAGLRERGVRYGAGRDMLGHRIAHAVLSQMEATGEAVDDRTHDAVRRARPVRAAVDATWPKADPVRLVFRLLADPAALAEASAGLLGEDERRAIAWPAPPRGPASAPWSAADAALVDEAADLIERVPSLAHVVLDEAQDLTPMECRAVGRRCATGSATVLGDLAQQTAPGAVGGWPEMLAHLGKQDAPVRVLSVGYRAPRQILGYAGRLLAHLAPGLPPARSLREDPASLAVVATSPGEWDGRLAALCADAVGRPGAAAVIAADEQTAAVSAALAAAGLAHRVLDGEVAGGRLTLVPASLAKGLEFDQVVVAEPAAIAASGTHGLGLLYVALTRAVSRLTVLHAEPLPDALR